MDNNNITNDSNDNLNSQLNTIISSNNNVTSNLNTNQNINSNLNNFNSTNNLNSNMINQNFNSVQNYETNLNQNKYTKKTKVKIIGLIILVLLVLIGIGGFFVLKNFRTNNTDIDLNLIFDPNKPIIVENNGKYGYITFDGKTMIEPQYKEADDFYGDYAVVTVDNTNPDSYKQNLYQIIDKKGNVKLTSESYVKPEYYLAYNLWLIDGALYDSKLNKISEEEISIYYISNGYFKYIDNMKNESGIMTYKGKKVFNVPGTYIFVYISDNKYNKDDLYASVTTYEDPKKQVVISLKTGDILFTSEDAESYNISEKNNGIFYYYNNKDNENGYKNRKYLFFKNNKLVYQTTENVDDVYVYNYEDQILEIDYGFDYKKIGKSQRKYYYDIKNKKMLEEKPSDSTSLDDLETDLIEQSYGFKKYSNSGKYGIMSGKNIIVPCEYDNVKYLNIDLFNYMKSKGKELVLLKKDNKTILYNLKKSEPITIFNSDLIIDFYNSTFLSFYLYSEDGNIRTGHKIYNLLSGKSMDFDMDSEISYKANYITVKKDNKIIYYNTEFKQIYVVNES